MKIAYLIPEFPGQTHIFFWREVQALRSLGVEVNLISTRKPNVICPHQCLEEAAKETRYLVPFHPTDIVALLGHPIKFLRALSYILKLSESSHVEKLKYIGFIICANSLRRFSQRQEIQHIHIQSCALSAHIGALCHILGGPQYSLVLQGDLEVYGKDHKSKMKYAAFVVAVNSPLKRQLIDMVGLNQDKICMFANGVDIEKFRPPHIQVQNNPLRLITVGRLNRSKGHLYVLRALQIVKKKNKIFEYIIVGDGDYRSEIENEISLLGLGKQVKLTGSAGEDEIIRLLQGSDIFILASYDLGESTAIAVREAMACGLPVVVTRIGSLDETVDYGRAGILVDQKNADQIAEALIEMANNPSMRRELSHAARQRAISCFDARLGAEILFDILSANYAKS